MWVSVRSLTWVSVRDAAALLKVSRSTIRRWVEIGDLPIRDGRVPLERAGRVRVEMAERRSVAGRMAAKSARRS